MRRDAVTFLTVYLVLLLALPSRLIVGPLGSAGTPAQIVATLGLFWWAWDWSSRQVPSTPRARPVRRAVLLFCAAILLSFVAAMARPVNGVELRAANAGLLSILAWIGLVLVTGDGIPNRERLETFLSRLSAGAGLLALFGLVQFATGRPLTDLIQVPGLTTNSALNSVLDRGGFSRPSGTAIHPIEFGVVLTVLMPLCLYTARRRRTSGIRAWWPVVCIGLAIPLSISRSAILGMALGLAIVVPTWERHARRLALLMMAAMGVVVYLAVPGMLGTLSDLFTGISGDGSTKSRTGSYTLAWSFIQQSPWVGRGYSTFLPDYRILDNAYLGLVIETGVIGTACLLGTFATAVYVAQRCRARSRVTETRELAQALTASTAAAAAGLAFFDALSFPMVSGLTFVVLGVTSCLDRLEAASPLPAGSPAVGPGVSVPRLHGGAAAAHDVAPQAGPRPLLE
jgi:O-antigen ligase